MKVNLKKIYTDKEVLKYVQSILRQQPVTKGLAKKLDPIVKNLEEIEVDLELSGECILELDKSRLDAVEERNKMANFLNKSDEL